MSTQDTAAAQTDEEVSSVAWLLRAATGSTKGVLELSGGRIAFTTMGVYHGAPLTGEDERCGGTSRRGGAPARTGSASCSRAAGSRRDPRASPQRTEGEMVSAHRGQEGER